MKEFEGVEAEALELKAEVAGLGKVNLDLLEVIGGGKVLGKVDGAEVEGWEIEKAGRIEAKGEVEGLVEDEAEVEVEGREGKELGSEVRSIFEFCVGVCRSSSWIMNEIWLELSWFEWWTIDRLQWGEDEDSLLRLDDDAEPPFDVSSILEIRRSKGERTEKERGEREEERRGERREEGRKGKERKGDKDF